MGETTNKTYLPRGGVCPACVSCGAETPRLVQSGGYCNPHYVAVRKGRPIVPIKDIRKPSVRAPKGSSLRYKFDLRSGADSPTEDGCWIWRAARLPSGYAVLNFEVDGRKSIYAHVAAYYLTHGYLPDPMVETIHHTCGNGSDGCVNPAHLQRTFSHENIAEMKERTAYRRHIERLEAEVERLVVALAEATGQPGLQSNVRKVAESFRA